MQKTTTIKSYFLIFKSCRTSGQRFKKDLKEIFLYFLEAKISLHFCLQPTAYWQVDPNSWRQPVFSQVSAYRLTQPGHQQVKQPFASLIFFNIHWQIYGLVICNYFFIQFQGNLFLKDRSSLISIYKPKFKSKSIS